jgi:IstB-like ATP binding protein
MEVIEDRYQRASTILATQVPIDRWHDMIGDPTHADAIMDRLVHNAYRANARVAPWPAEDGTISCLQLKAMPQELSRSRTRQKYDNQYKWCCYY